MTFGPISSLPINALGVSVLKSTGVANGSSFTSGVGESLFTSEFTANGSSFTGGVGESLDEGIFTANGSSFTGGVGESLFTSEFTTNGSSFTGGVGESLFTSEFTANGSSSVNGFSLPEQVITVLYPIGAFVKAGGKGEKIVGIFATKHEVIYAMKSGAKFYEKDIGKIIESPMYSTLLNGSYEKVFISRTDIHPIYYVPKYKDIGVLEDHGKRFAVKSIRLLINAKTGFQPFFLYLDNLNILHNEYDIYPVG